MEDTNCLKCGGSGVDMVGDPSGQSRVLESVDCTACCGRGKQLECHRDGDSTIATFADVSHAGRKLHAQIDAGNASWSVLKDLADDLIRYGDGNRAYVNGLEAENAKLRKERLNLLGRIRRIACNHKGIGLPGCTVCDPKWQEHVEISLGESI